jgi:NACalpha-BTF3-like transcription factor
MEAQALAVVEAQALAVVEAQALAVVEAQAQAKAEEVVKSQESKTPDSNTQPQVSIETQSQENPLINVIMRQTDYSKELAIEKLNQHNNDVLSIIREYMNPPIPEVKENKSTSQMIYGEIRSLMGNAAKNYRMKKEMEERRQQMQETAIANARALYEKQQLIKEQQIQYHKNQQQAFREQAAKQLQAASVSSSETNSSVVDSSSSIPSTL